MVSPALREDLDRTVPMSVSVTTMAFVCPPRGSVCAGPATLESGVRTSAQWGRMVRAVRRRVAVRTMENATTPTACVCVSLATQGRRVRPGCVPRATTDSSVTKSAPVLPPTRAGVSRCLVNAHVVLGGQACTVMRLVLQVSLGSCANKFVSARTAQTATA